MKNRKAEYKPLLFTTTLRNPTRMKDFLNVLSKYDNQVLNNTIIDKVVFDLIKNKKYVPEYINKQPSLRTRLVSDSVFSDGETKEIIKNSPQNHKEAGFEKGWPSRFDTWFKFLKELGFVYYKMNEPIKLSESGLKLVKALDEGCEYYEHQVFLNAFVKYQRVNPYLKVLNNNKPLILLLQAINELKKQDPNSAGISINEIPLFICWKDNNYLKLVGEIKKIRDEYGFKPSNEVIYDICKKLLDIDKTGEKRFKSSNILKEMPDEFIRKMRLTGLISLRGLGRFVDINTNELKKIDYVLKTYAKTKEFKNEEEYFNYMSVIDPMLVMESTSTQLPESKKRQKFVNFVNEFSIELIKKELLILVAKKSLSHHEVFKFIDEPLRLEFLTSLLLQKRYPKICVKPNYSTDDEGIPTAFAKGNTPDIVCEDKDGNILFEVTLIVGSQQCPREMPPISKHLIDQLAKGKEAFSVLLAPHIHSYTLDYSKFMKYKNNIDIVPIDIPYLVKSIDKINNLWELRIEK